MKIVPELTVEQYMAVAVLKGDMTTARILADKLCEHWAAGQQILTPVQIIDCPIERVRVAVFWDWKAISDPDWNIHRQPDEDIASAVRNWLEHGTVITFAGIERIELYQLPEKP
jgi:hypothetical protein